MVGTGTYVGISRLEIFEEFIEDVFCTSMVRTYVGKSFLEDFEEIIEDEFCMSMLRR